MVAEGKFRIVIGEHASVGTRDRYRDSRQLKRSSPQVTLKDHRPNLARVRGPGSASSIGLVSV